MRYISIFILIIAMSVGSIATLCSQQLREDEDAYFTYKKYAFTYLYFSRISKFEYKGGGLGERTIKTLANKLVRGFNALYEKRPDDAISLFRGAQKVLPEYFHLDFIIALSYEEKADYKNASRFYISYLEKLKKFHEGMFPITKSLTYETVDFNIESYPEAKELIRSRLARHGIDFEKAAQRRYPIIPILIAISALMALIAIVSMLRGKIRRSIYNAKAAMHPKSDSWICKYCGTENANINNTCYNCGKKQKEL